MIDQCETAPAIGRRSSRYAARQQCTSGVAAPPRADHTDSRHAPTDDEVEQLVQILLDRLDEQGSPTYVRQQRLDPDAIAPQHRGHAFRAVHAAIDVPIECTVWSEHSMLWQVRRVSDPTADTAAAGGRA